MAGDSEEERKRGDRIAGCSTRWGVCIDLSGHILSHVLNRCHDKFCPVCSERRARHLRTWVRAAVASQLDLWGDMRYALLTLTPRNVPVDELGAAVDDLRVSFARLTKLKDWPAAGYVQFLEVTHAAGDTAHPHLHVLLALHPEYFTDRSQDATYLPWDKWVDLWKQSLRVTYRPVLDVRPVRPSKRLLRRWRQSGRGRLLTAQERTAEMCIDAVAEVCKYPMEYDQTLMADPEWFRRCAAQLRSKRQWSAGGIFKVTIRAAKQADEKERDARREERDRTLRRIIWYKWNGWDYIRCKPHEERQCTTDYHMRRARAQACRLKRLRQRTRDGP